MTATLWSYLLSNSATVSQSAGSGRIAVEAGIEPDVALQFGGGFEGSVGDAINANEFRGNALADFRIVVRGAQDGQASVRVQINKAGTDDVIGGINDTGRLQVGGVATVDGETLVLHQHCGVKARATTAIDDQAVGDEQIKHGILRLQVQVPGVRKSLAGWPGQCAGAQNACC